MYGRRRRRASMAGKEHVHVVSVAATPATKTGVAATETNAMSDAKRPRTH